MKITITSTDQITELGGVPVRVWDGVTESGIACKVFVHRLAVLNGADTTEFDRELHGMSVPPELATRTFIPLRNIL